MMMMMMMVTVAYLVVMFIPKQTSQFISFGSVLNRLTLKWIPLTLEFQRLVCYEDLWWSFQCSYRRRRCQRRELNTSIFFFFYLGQHHPILYTVTTIKKKKSFYYCIRSFDLVFSFFKSTKNSTQHLNQKLYSTKNKYALFSVPQDRSWIKCVINC